MYLYHQELRIAEKIARQAGERMRKYFDGDQGVEKKADASFVTVADKEINTLVIQELERAFPEDGVIGEEESTAGYGAGRKWFCDPIDGTKAFVWGVPTAMFSLGLVIDGVPVMGVAYDPFLDRLYAGVAGEVSTCNGQELRVSAAGLDVGIVAASSNPSVLTAQKLSQVGIETASFSGAVYKSCLVARGKFVGYLEPGVNAHDMAAVQVIVEGAGGQVTGLRGEVLDYTRPFKGAIVSNGLVHGALHDFVQ